MTTPLERFREALQKGEDMCDTIEVQTDDLEWAIETLGHLSDDVLSGESWPY